MAVLIILLAILIIFTIGISLFASKVLSYSRDIESNISLLRQRCIRLSEYIIDNYSDEEILDSVDKLLNEEHIKAMYYDASSICIALEDDSTINGYKSEIDKYYIDTMNLNNKFRLYISRWYNRGFSSILAVERRDYFEF